MRMRTQISVGSGRGRDRVRIRAGCGAVALAAGLPVASVVAQQAIDVSDDGMVWATPGGVDGAGPQADGVLYRATPDWQVNLRRQVGALVIADLNNDGKNDLFVGCYTSASQPPYPDWHDMIFFNTGSGFADTPGWISADHIHTGDAQVGDVNGDGIPDVVAISGGTALSPVRAYYGHAGAGSMPSTSPDWISTPPRTGWPTSGLLFDIDADGDLDLVTTNQGVSPDPFRPMYFFRNSAVQGGPGLETSPSWQSAESSIQNGLAAADIDGDQDLDLAVAKWVNFQTGIYRNAGGTLETTPAWTTGDSGTDKGVAFADVDGNGWQDLAVGHDEPSRLYSNTDGVFSLTWEAEAPFFGQQDVRFADVDRDGDMDYAEVHFGDGRTHLYLNRSGTLDVPPSWTYDAVEVGTALAFGDINGDGWTDMAIGYSGNVCVRVFLAVPPECRADFNGDSVVDFFDYLDFAAAFDAEAAAADFNGDAVVDFFDYLDFVAAFDVGCE
jgi:hypothetical protein